MSYSSTDALYCVAKKRGQAGTLDYAAVFTASLDKIIAEGPDANAALQGDVRGHDLYTFLEPGGATLAAALQAGIRNVYCVLSRQDAERLGITARALRPKTYWRVRNEVAEELECKCSLTF